MATYNADGTTAAPEQLTPPDDIQPVINDPIDSLPEHPSRPFREDEPRSEGAVARVAPDPDGYVTGTGYAPEDVTGPAEAEPEVVETPAPSTEVALTPRFDVTTTGEDWKHDFLEFKGDKLAIRRPASQALAAFSLASSKYVSLNVKNDLTGLFIARHLSEESYSRVFSRLMDPDETEYDVDTVGELFNAIVQTSLDAASDDDSK